MAQLSALAGIDHDYDASQRKLTTRGITEIPRQFYEAADKVEILDLGGNHISQLPHDFGRLSNLRILFASNTDFETLPRVLGECSRLEMIGIQGAKKLVEVPAESLSPSLRAITLTENAIASLPDCFDKLPNLVKLAAAGNRLTKLPESLLACKNLELVRFAVNQLAKTPNWLLRHPALAWYADGANPYNMLKPAPGSERTISWSELSDINLLSQNRKNRVYAATITASGKRAAVKLYGMPVTIDGLTEDEIHISLLMGNADDSMARVTDAPDDWPGLMMPLFGKDMRNLGSPPSFQTFTRDVYPNEARFENRNVTKIISELAEQLTDLHAKRIMHGDVYAHNIMFDGVAHAVLTDFGSAAVYQPTADRLHERVEVKALGILMQELADRCDGPSHLLTDLAAACTQDDILSRPLFANIADALQHT